MPFNTGKIWPTDIFNGNAPYDSSLSLVHAAGNADVLYDTDGVYFSCEPAVLASRSASPAIWTTEDVRSKTVAETPSLQFDNFARLPVCGVDHTNCPRMNPIVCAKLARQPLTTHWTSLDEK